jgi:hypothetical protein
MHGSRRIEVPVSELVSSDASLKRSVGVLSNLNSPSEVCCDFTPSWTDSSMGLSSPTNLDAIQGIEETHVHVSTQSHGSSRQPHHNHMICRYTRSLKVLLEFRIKYTQSSATKSLIRAHASPFL